MNERKGEEKEEKEKKKEKKRTHLTAHLTPPAKRDEKLTISLSENLHHHTFGAD